VQHTAYDDFWKERSFIRRAAEITIPTLHGGVWYDHFGRGTLTSHEAIDAPKRLFMSPGSLMTRTDLGDGGFGRLQIRWFDHFLRGADNGVLDEPPVRLYLMGREDYIDEPAWPVPVVDTDFFLRAGPSGSRRPLARTGGSGSDSSSVKIHPRRPGCRSRRCRWSVHHPPPTAGAAGT